MPKNENRRADGLRHVSEYIPDHLKKPAGNWRTAPEAALYFQMEESQFRGNLVVLGLLAEEENGMFARTELGKRFSNFGRNVKWDVDAIEALFSTAAPAAGLAKKGDG